MLPRGEARTFLTHCGPLLSKRSVFVVFFLFFPLNDILETIHFFTFQRLSKLRLFVIMPVSGAERPDDIASSNRPWLPSPGSDKRTTLPPGGPFVIGRRVAADKLVTGGLCLTIVE